MHKIGGGKIDLKEEEYSRYWQFLLSNFKFWSS